MSAKSGSLSIACVQLGPRKLSVIWSSGVSAIQGLLEVNEGQSGLSELSIILWVSAVQGCQLSGVPVLSTSINLELRRALNWQIP